GKMECMKHWNYSKVQQSLWSRQLSIWQNGPAIRPELMQGIPEKDRALDSLIKLDSDLPGVYPITKALGLKWNTRTGSLIFMVKVKSLKFKIKRKLASLATKIFDSNRSHYTLYSEVKVIVSEFVDPGVCWDNEIPAETSIKWIQWIQEL
ncbi:hypothetical protein OS493_008202, partial [Desmophyllum pertusum]